MVAPFFTRDSGEGEKKKKKKKRKRGSRKSERVGKGILVGSFARSLAACAGKKREGKKKKEKREKGEEGGAQRTRAGRLLTPPS